MEKYTTTQTVYAEQFLPPEKIPISITLTALDEYVIFIPKSGYVHTFKKGEWVVYNEFKTPIAVMTDSEFKEKYKKEV